jgi:CRISPR-associated endonuclease/helicase Cas3
MTADLMDIARSLRSTSQLSSASHTTSEQTLDQWFARAEGRPAFMLWGKAHDGQPWPMHPLVCHVLDVAAVAARLLAQVMSPALRERLLACDPDRERAFRTLLFIVALHDLGKATPAFQHKRPEARAPLQARGFDLERVKPQDRHHGDIGFWLLRDALKSRGAGTSATKLARAVAAHHGEFPLDAGGPPESRQSGGAAWTHVRSQFVDDLALLFDIRDALAPAVPNYDHAFVITLAGLTSVADWVGSMDQVFRYEAPPESLTSYWALALDRAETALAHAGLRPAAPTNGTSFAALFPGYSPWPLHRAAEEIGESLTEPSLVIVEAPMGEGKTEAAFLLATSNEVRAQQHGFFIGLPTQATANQMFSRTRDFLTRTRPGVASTLVLAHGEASLVADFEKVRIAAIYGHDLERRDTPGHVQAEGWFLSKKRTLLAEHAVGTVDQALLSVLRVGHGFVRVYGLAGKTVILDEVHAYDTYTSKMLDRLLEWLAAVGASVVLLSATLPSQRRRALAEAYARGRGLPAPDATSGAPYPRLTVCASSGTREHRFVPRRAPARVTLDRCPTDIDSILRVALEATASGGCAGILLNTVSRAQHARGRLNELAPAVDALLLHARMFPDDRVAREEKLVDWLGPAHRAKSRPHRAIVIGTQVLEQSLDVDFDVLITDLAPIDLVLQRAGRLHRHDRASRPALVRVPRLVLALPDDDADGLREVAPMYSALIVRRTLAALRDRTVVEIPTEIEPLVERVYDASTIPEAGSDDYDAFLEHHGAQRVQASLAAEKLLPSPAHEDDPFGEFDVFLLDDEDPARHQRLAAATRLGRPSLDLVFLEAREGELFAGSVPIRLDHAPSREAAAALVRRSISISSPTLFAIASAIPVPPGWKQHGALRHRRPVSIDGGRAALGSSELRLDPDLGLVISAPTSRKGKT